MHGVLGSRHQGFALLALSALSLGVAVLLGNVLSGVPLCGVKALSGLPCPFCGGVRATAALAGGSPVEAFAWNPAVTLLHAGMFASGVFLILGRTPAWLVPERQRLVFRAALVILLANWIYLIAVGR